MPKLVTTYSKIKSFRPCLESWELLLAKTNPTVDLDKEIELMTILKNCGIRDAVWALRCWDYKNWCLFVCEVTESMLHIVAEAYPARSQAHAAIATIKKYATQDVEHSDLLISAAGAYEFYVNSYEYSKREKAVSFIIYAAYMVAVAASRPCTIDAMNSAYTICVNIVEAAHMLYEIDPLMAECTSVRPKWKHIEQIFTKYFGENNEK